MCGKWKIRSRVDLIKVCCERDDVEARETSSFFTRWKKREKESGLWGEKERRNWEGDLMYDRSLCFILISRFYIEKWWKIFSHFLFWTLGSIVFSPKDSWRLIFLLLVARRKFQFIVAPYKLPFLNYLFLSNFMLI